MVIAAVSSVAVIEGGFFFDRANRIGRTSKGQQKHRMLATRKKADPPQNHDLNHAYSGVSPITANPKVTARPNSPQHVFAYIDRPRIARFIWAVPARHITVALEQNKKLPSELPAFQPTPRIQSQSG